MSGLEIRLNGTNQTPSEHIKLGAHHTLEVELHRPFTVHKDCWDKLDLLRVRQATNPAATADLAVLLISVSLRPSCLAGLTSCPHLQGVRVVPATWPTGTAAIGHYVPVERVGMHASCEL